MVQFQQSIQAVTIKGNAEICNNSAGYRGGAIYTEGTTNDSSLLNIEGGTISGNHVNGSGAGIFAICSRGNKHNMDVIHFRWNDNK